MLCKQPRRDRTRTTALFAQNCSFFKTLLQAGARGFFAASAKPFLARALSGSRAGSSSQGLLVPGTFWGVDQLSHLQLSLKPPQLPLPSLLTLAEFTSTRRVCPSRRRCSTNRAQQDEEGHSSPAIFPPAQNPTLPQPQCR